MAIGVNPITLPLSNAFTPTASFGSVTTLLAYLRAETGVHIPNRVYQMLDACNVGKTDYGAGIVFEKQLDYLDDTNNDRKVSTLLTDNQEAVIGQEILYIDTYKKINLTTWQELTAAVGVDEAQVSATLQLCLDLVEKSHSAIMYGRLVDQILAWTPKATQKIEIQISQADFVDKVDAAVKIYETIANIKSDMLEWTNAYCDVDKYTTDDGTTQKNIRMNIDEARSGFILNTKFKNLLAARGQAILFNGKSLNELAEVGRVIDIAPRRLGVTDLLNVTDGETIGYLVENPKFAISEFYKLQMAWKDPSNLANKIWLHYAYGLGVRKLPQAVQFVVKLV